MKRVITIVQRKGMQGVLSHAGRSNRRPAHCAHCRNARCDGRSFVCELGRAIGTICEAFRDAREPLAANWMKTL